MQQRYQDARNSGDHRRTAQRRRASGAFEAIAELGELTEGLIFVVFFEADIC